MAKTFCASKNLMKGPQQDYCMAGARLTYQQALYLGDMVKSTRASGTRGLPRVAPKWRACLQARARPAVSKAHLKGV